MAGPFPIEDCTDPSGDPIVFYDEISDRWVLTQFTTRFETNQFYICMAVSQTSDALGSYNLYAFSTGDAFPDYPKYGHWRDSYVFTTREFPPDDTEQIGIYAVKRFDMVADKPTPRMVKFILEGPPNLVGDGLLPADVDGRRQRHRRLRGSSERDRLSKGTCATDVRGSRRSRRALPRRGRRLPAGTG